MKKLLPLLLLVPMSPVFSDIKQEFVTSAQITVDMPYVVTNKVGTTYSLSGNNITPSVTVGDTTTAGKIGGIRILLMQLWRNSKNYSQLISWETIKQTYENIK